MFFGSDGTRWFRSRMYESFDGILDYIAREIWKEGPFYSTKYSCGGAGTRVQCLMGNRISMSASVVLEQFNEDEPVETFPLMKSLGSLIRFANQIRSDVSNAVRVIASDILRVSKTD